MGVDESEDSDSVDVLLLSLLTDGWEAPGNGPGDGEVGGSDVQDSTGATGEGDGRALEK